MEFSSSARRYSWFTKFATRIARLTGHPLAFALAVLSIVVWSVLGPVYRYSDTWQLVINTSTTIVTFLMVFLIQNTQNRDAHAVQIKLDELIRAHKSANNALLNVELLDDCDLDALSAHYEALARKAAAKIHERRGDKRGPAQVEAIVGELERAKLDRPDSEAPGGRTMSDGVDSHETMG